jgi:alpha-tubulin suppressor-like RCC1 family protein
VKCWGDNLVGQLGDGTTHNTRSTPVDVHNLTGVSWVSAGGAAGSQHTCALLTSGTIKCWGDDVYGQLGDGTTANIPPKAEPVDVLNIRDATAIAAGDTYTCAIVGTGKVECWGYSVLGSLGNGTTGNSLVPVEALNVTDAVGIAAGSSHSCVVLRSGNVQCWGKSDWGQVGDGNGDTSAPPRTSPVDVVNICP